MSQTPAEEEALEAAWESHKNTIQDLYLSQDKVTEISHGGHGGFLWLRQKVIIPRSFHTDLKLTAPQQITVQKPLHEIGLSQELEGASLGSR